MTFAGTLDAELPDHYRAADMLVMPSDFEAFGLVQIEAMACAKPVIVTSVPGARIVSVDGEHGLHVRPAMPGRSRGAMRELAAMEPAARAAMGERGRRRVLDATRGRVRPTRSRPVWQRRSETADRRSDRSFGSGGVDSAAAARVVQRGDARSKSMGGRSANLVVVPAYNESATVVGVLEQIAEHAPGWDVVVVDDGSTDDTARALADAGAQVLRMPFNVGIGGAVQAGFTYALENGYARMVQIDGDGQHDPSQLARLRRGAGRATPASTSSAARAS